MTIRQLRRRCRKLLRELSVAQPLDIDEVVQKLSESRHRRIELAPRPQAPGSFGCVMPMPGLDVIVFHAQNSAERTHILAHELAHLFLGHLNRADDGGLALVCGFDAVTTPRQRSQSTSSMYDPQAEWAAETAAIILSGWSTSAVTGEKTIVRSPAAPEPVLARLDQAFGDLREW